MGKRLGAVATKLVEMLSRQNIETYFGIGNETHVILESKQLNTRMYSTHYKDVLEYLWSMLHGGMPGEQLYKLHAAILWVLSKFALEDASGVVQKEIIGFGLHVLLDFLATGRVFVQSDALGNSY